MNTPPGGGMRVDGNPKDFIESHFTFSLSCSKYLMISTAYTYCMLMSVVRDIAASPRQHKRQHLRLAICAVLCDPNHVVTHVVNQHITNRYLIDGIRPTKHDSDRCTMITSLQ